MILFLYKQNKESNPEQSQNLCWPETFVGWKNTSCHKTPRRAIISTGQSDSTQHLLRLDFPKWGRAILLGHKTVHNEGNHMIISRGQKEIFHNTNYVFMVNLDKSEQIETHVVRPVPSTWLGQGHQFPEVGWVVSAPG